MSMTEGILSSHYQAVNAMAIRGCDHVTLRHMAIERAPEPSQFRVTLFVGPQPVKGRPFTYSCVFNVKKRSWKGGIQVDVAIAQDQVDRLSTDVDFSSWLGRALTDLPDDDRPTYQERAWELFIQALCWCKLDLALQSGITQENQCLAEDIWIAEVRDSASSRTNFIKSYIVSELDLVPGDAAAS